MRRAIADFHARTFAPRWAPRHAGLGSTILPALTPSLPPTNNQTFNSLSQEAQQGWTPVGQQLVSEGVSPLSQQYSDVQTQYANAVTGLAQNIPTGTIAPGDVISAAQNYVTSAYTIAGTVNQVEGLITATQHGASWPTVVEGFTGIAIGTLAATGVVTAGVGAAVGAAILAGISIAQWVASLFGSPPKPSAQVGACTVSPPPAYAIQWNGSDNSGTSGGTAVYTDGASSPATANAPAGAVVDGPASPYWRRFPDPTNQADAAWYQQGGQVGSWTSGQSTDTWGVCYGQAAANPFLPRPALRPVDAAWPMYRQLECDTLTAQAILGVNIPAGQSSVVQSIAVANGPQGTVTITPELQAFAQFQIAFFNAWKANQEYTLNGLKAQQDWQVLDRMLYLWNTARSPGNGFVLAAPSATSSAANATPAQTCTTPQVGGSATCALSPCAIYSSPNPFYVDLLVPAVGQQASASIGYNATANTITLSTGPSKNALLVVPIRIGGAGIKAGGVGPTAASSSPSSAGTAFLVAGGVTALAVGGVYAYGRSRGMTFRETVRSFGRGRPSRARARR